jgi:hypothetical protein
MSMILLAATDALAMSAAGHEHDAPFMEKKENKSR